MTKQLWSINALSVELGTDRRTLAKRLADLPPDEEKAQAGKRVRRWRLARVLEHLSRSPGRSRQEDIEAEGCRRFNEILGQVLFPSLVTSRYFTGFFVASMHQDFGLSKPSALRAYQTGALAYALAEACKGDTLMFEVPPIISELQEIGPEAYAAKYWTKEGDRSSRGGTSIRSRARE